MMKHLDLRAGLLLMGLLAQGHSVAAEPVVASVAAAPAQAGEMIYARVDGKPITLAQFNALFAETLRERYYHAKVPEGQDAVVRQQVTDRLVDRLLLLEDARRRGLQPDEQSIARGLAAADAKYAGTPMWKERDRLLAELREILANQSLIEQLGKRVREVPQPTAAEVRAYFDSHLDMFTVPEKLRLSVILLRVDPAAPLEDWSKALEQAQGIHRQLLAGADFAELARQRSGDSSAKDGGDLGYLHRGMLPPTLHFEIDKLQVGVPSEPIRGLEGYSVFRLAERVPARHQEYARGESRARDLLLRERQEAAWKQNIERLRSAAKIEILVQPDEKK